MAQDYKLMSWGRNCATVIKAKTLVIKYSIVEWT